MPADPAFLFPSVRNGILAALPASVLAALLPRLQPVTFGLRKVLHAAGAPIKAVHFHEEGWASMVAQPDDGLTAEVGLVGREGMVGLLLAFGVETAYVEAMVQGPGLGLRMEAGTFRVAVLLKPGA